MFAISLADITKISRELNTKKTFSYILIVPLETNDSKRYLVAKKCSNEINNNNILNDEETDPSLH